MAPLLQVVLAVVVLAAACYDTKVRKIPNWLNLSGVILGVANNRSIAYGIARACRAQGAELAFTWQGDALKKRVEPLAKELNGLLLGHCDVTDPSTIDAVFDVLKEKWGKIDFVVHAIAFSDKDELDGRYL